jgi:hypothetical protein
MDQLVNITNIHSKPTRVMPATDQLINQLINIPNNEMYQRIDQILVGCIGQSINFNQLVHHIQTQDATAYEQVVIRSQRILKPIHALS